jgi:ERCC4-type nuclease
MEIIIDDRERAITDIIKSVDFPPNITYKITRINIGDYNILYNGVILFSIERKTWKDLSASIKDGRKNNINKMIDLRKETNCRLIYIMEGKTPSIDSKVSNIPYKNLLSHLDHIMIRDNIYVLHSNDKKGTIMRLISLIQNFITIKPSLLPCDNTINGGENDILNKLKQITIPTDVSIIYKIWCCLPYITEKTAFLFIEGGYHISDLILGKIPKDIIYSLKSDNYIIGNKSEKIWKYSRITIENKKYFINMITQIRGISKKTAVIIYDTISFESLLNNEITINQLKDIKKTEKLKLGQKMADNIFKFFIKV